MDQALMPMICKWENLTEAWERVEDNDGCPGIDGVSVDRFELDLGDNLLSNWDIMLVMATNGK